MAKLECEICGGKLVARPDGLFECEYCGMQYDKLKVQQMVQEIKGTVKVEGPVQVEGTVKVEGGQNIDALITMGFRELEQASTNKSEHRTNAKELFMKALTYDAQNGDALLGKLITEEAFMGLADIKEIRGNRTCNTREKFWQRLAHNKSKNGEAVLSSPGFKMVLDSNKSEGLSQEIENYHKELERWTSEQQRIRRQEKEEQEQEEREAVIEKLTCKTKREEIRKQVTALEAEIESTFRNLQKEIEDYNRQKASLGLFKGKEKKEIQSKIDFLTCEMDQKYKADKNALRKLKLQMHGVEFTERGELKFGRYKLNGNEDSIEWIILEEKQDSMLITSKHAIDARSFSDYDNSHWEGSGIRAWLNKDFIIAAFDEEEQELIKTTTLITKNYIDCDSDRVYLVNKQQQKPQQETMDQVFLLSLEEVKKYFPDDNSRKLSPSLSLQASQKTKINSSFDGFCEWWLRTRVISNGPLRSVVPKCVYVDDSGTLANSSNHLRGYSPRYDKCGVRPAMWLNIL